MSKRIVACFVVALLLASPVWADYPVRDGSYQGSNGSFLTRIVSTATGGGGSEVGSITSGLQYRWDATSLNLSDSEQVTSWVDDTSARELYPDGNYDTPIYNTSFGDFGDSPAVYFDGDGDAEGADLLRTDRRDTKFPQPWTIAVVFAPDDDVGSSERGTVFNDVEDFNPTFGYYGDLNDWLENDGSSLTISFSNSANIASGRIWVGMFNGSSSKIRINQNENTGDAGESGGGIRGVVLGARYDGSTPDRVFKGHISEVRFYTRELSSSEITELENHLISKWNLTL